MEQEKNNNGVVIVLGVIVVILLALVILLATGTIGSKSKKVDNNAADKTQADKVTTDDKTADNTTTNNTTNTTNNNTNVAQQVRYYQYYDEFKQGSETYYKSREVVLNTDKTAKWHFGGNASGGDEYKGTYTEDSSKIVLTLERDMEGNAKCDDNESEFPCKTTLTLTKSNNTLVEKSADGISYTYKLVEKKQLKLFN